MLIVTWTVIIGGSSDVSVNQTSQTLTLTSKVLIVLRNKIRQIHSHYL